jgi:hypothetical protein
MLATCIDMQHLNLLLQQPDKTLAIFVWNGWNIWNIHLKYTCIAITTCAIFQSTFTTSIYNTCNISRKHLNHLKHTIATCAFQRASTCYLDEWRLVNAGLDAGTEIMKGDASPERASERLAGRACRARCGRAAGVLTGAARARTGFVLRA